MSKHSHAYGTKPLLPELDKEGVAPTDAQNWPLIIIGAGGHGAEVATYALDSGLSLLGALDDGRAVGRWHASKIIGAVGTLPAICRQYNRVKYITALGNNRVRRDVVQRIEAMELNQLKPFVLAHRSAWTGSGVEIDLGTLLAPNSLVTTNAVIGRHCIINVQASISHDCIIGDWCNINPSATLCGDVHLGEGCYVGAGATIVEKRKIGAWTVIGAGAVVTTDLPPGVTAVGVPARIIKRRPPSV